MSDGTGGPDRKVAVPNRIGEPWVARAPKYGSPSKQERRLCPTFSRRQRRSSCWDLPRWALRTHAAGMGALLTTATWAIWVRRSDINRSSQWGRSSTIRVHKSACRTPVALWTSSPRSWALASRMPWGSDKRLKFRHVKDSQHGGSGHYFVCRLRRNRLCPSARHQLLPRLPRARG